MTKRHQHKFRICRQLGENLWNSSKQFKIEKTPGEHGKTPKKNADNRYEPRYSTQLKEKQKLKKYYGGLTEKQFFTIFEKAMKLKGEPSTSNLITLLEKRLETVVYRMGFAKSFFESKQLINHGHIKVNGLTVTFPSFLVDTGSIVAVKEIKELELNKGTVPSYLEIDAPLKRGVFFRNPRLEELPYSRFNLKAVIEFYSR